MEPQVSYGRPTAAAARPRQSRRCTPCRACLKPYGNHLGFLENLIVSFADSLLEANTCLKPEVCLKTNARNRLAKEALLRLSVSIMGTLQDLCKTWKFL
jgi:hypothetical protein